MTSKSKSRRAARREALILALKAGDYERARQLAKHLSFSERLRIDALTSTEPLEPAPVEVPDVDALLAQADALLARLGDGEER